MPTSLILDKRKLFELFMHAKDRGKKHQDSELVKTLDDVMKLWTQMMLEEYDHDQKCLENVHDMQKMFDDWLTELFRILRAALAQSAPDEASQDQINILIFGYVY